MRGQQPSPVTYVVFETGRAASREQIRIDIPIIFVDVSYVGAAFPRLVFYPDFLPQLRVQSGSVQTATSLVADMDAIIALDFKNEWPAILSKTLISTTSKAVATYFINRAGHDVDPAVGWLFRLGTAIAGAALNIADTRTWTTLPKQFQVSRVPTPADRQLNLTAGSTPISVTLEQGLVNVVYVRSITVSGPLMVSQFVLK
jgi:uncharacterized protein